MDIEGDLKPLPEHRTRVKMLWDETYFYFYSKMDEPHIWAKLTERDAVMFYDDDFEIFLYNRWGELVYQSNDKNFRWNGGYNNDASSPMPSGTYVYVIKFVSEYQPERGIQEKRGGVVLLR